MDLLKQDDFFGLPEEPGLAWLRLEAVARARMEQAIEGGAVANPPLLIRTYISSISELAVTYGIEKVLPPPHSGAVGEELDQFKLAVNRAQMRIWSTSGTTAISGQISLGREAREKILDLTNEIQKEIDALDKSERDKKLLSEKLEDFRREIENPTIGLAKALNCLAQVSVVVASLTTTASQAPDAITNILMLFGAAQIEASEAAPQLTVPVKNKLLPAPPKMLSAPNDGPL